MARICVCIFFYFISCHALAQETESHATAILNDAKPNVLFVSIDDLNDWIEPLGGHPQARTPNLNRLARRAVNFTNAHCPSPGCNPSRTAIMTGLAPYTSGVYSNYQDWREIITDSKTIGAYFREHGYYSAGAGKIFHYHMVDPSCWDEYWPSQKQNMPTEFMPDKTSSSLATEANPKPLTMNMPMFQYMYGMFDWYPMEIEDSEMADCTVGQDFRKTSISPPSTFSFQGRISGVAGQRQRQPVFVEQVLEVESNTDRLFEITRSPGSATAK